jgi:glucose 1-dehydrogenase
MANTSITKQRTVLVTGAAGGIGRATVDLFTQKGWRVIGVDRSAYDDTFPENGLFIQDDISKGENLETIFLKSQEFTNQLNALVNNAALQIAKPLVQTSVEEWDAVMASNLRSVFLAMKLAHPLLKAARGGAIGNVGFDQSSSYRICTR